MRVGPFGFPMRFLERGLQVSNPKFEIVAALQGRLKGEKGKTCTSCSFLPCRSQFLGLDSAACFCAAGGRIFLARRPEQVSASPERGHTTYVTPFKETLFPIAFA